METSQSGPQSTLTRLGRAPSVGIMDHNCERETPPLVCNNEMDCPCSCNACNAAARRQMAERLKALMRPDPQRAGALIDYNLNSH